MEEIREECASLFLQLWRRFRPQIWAIRLHFQALLFDPSPPRRPRSFSSAVGNPQRGERGGRGSSRNLTLIRRGDRLHACLLDAARDGYQKNSITACDAAAAAKTVGEFPRRRETATAASLPATCARRGRETEGEGEPDDRRREREGGRDGDDGNSGNHRLTSRDGETRGEREGEEGREEADYLRDLRRPLNPYRKRGVDFISQSENSHQQKLAIRAGKKAISNQKFDD